MALGFVISRRCNLLLLEHRINAPWFNYDLSLDKPRRWLSPLRHNEALKSPIVSLFSSASNLELFLSDIRVTNRGINKLNPCLQIVRLS